MNRVLLIEDDVVDAKASMRMLTRLGYEVVHVDLLERAKALLLREPFDVVLLDWRLPDGRAASLVPHLKEHRVEVPVVVLTGMEGGAPVEAALHAGAQDYLVKGSFDPKALARSLDYAIARGRAQALEARLAQTDRLASVGRLAAGVAHEVNNPAMFIMGNLEFLRGLPIIDPAVRAELDACIDQCEIGMHRITSVMRQLAGFARIASGTPTRVRLEKVVEQAIRMARPSMRHRAEITQDLGEVDAIVADRSALIGVIVNLLVNAQQAIDTMPGDDHQIRVTLHQDALGIHLVVDDSGPGIPDSQVARVFEPFFSRNKPDGAGLGLSVVGEVIANHRGTVEVSRSALGGARFAVFLPLDTGLVCPETSASSPPLLDVVALVIDDEPLLRATLRRMLPGEVHEAESVAQAKARIEENDFDVIICDVMMPDGGGQAVYEWVVQTAPELASRFVFVTGGAVTPAAEDFCANVDAAVLMKPFSSGELARAVRDVQAERE